MATDIVGSIGKLLGGQSSTVSALIGESEERTSAGLRAIIPALLAGLMSRGADSRGARELFGRLTSSSVDAGLSGDLPSLLGSRGGFDALIGSGRGLLGYLTGGRTDQVSEAVARSSGIKSSSASALLGMATPLLFSFLKRQVMDGGLDAGGLKSLLMGQAPLLQKMDLDPRITRAMGVPDLQEVLGTHDSGFPDVEDARAPARTRAPSPPDRRWLGWVLGLAGAVLVAGMLWSLFSSPSDTRSRTLPDLSSGRTSVYFDPARAVLDGDDWKVIESVAASARTDARAVVLTGTTTRTGDVNQNLKLAEKRVAAVRDGLLAVGVPAQRIVMQPPMLASEADARSPRVQIDLRTAP